MDTYRSSSLPFFNASVFPNDTGVTGLENFYHYYYDVIQENNILGKFIALYLILITSCICSANVSKCPKIVSDITLALSLNVTAILLSPCGILAYGFILLVRRVLILAFWMGTGDNLLLMDPPDVAWAVERPYQCNNFTSLYVLEGKCDLADIRNRIQRQLLDKREKGKLVYKRLKYSVIKKFGFYCWQKCEHFRIDDNVKLMSKDKEEFTEEQVFEGLRAVADVPMTAEKPQWEILVVPKFIYTSARNRNGEYYAIIFRVHHSIMDGVSAGHALKFALADKPMKLSVNPLKGPRINPFILGFIYLKALILAPFILFHATTVRENNCFSNKVISGPKTFGWSRPISMKALKMVKDSWRTTTTAVLMNSLGGAIRTLALKKNLPVPRRILTAPTIAMLPYPDAWPRNRFIVIHFPLEIGLPSRKERLEAAHDTARSLSSSVAPLVIFQTVKCGGRLPAILAEFLMCSLSATLIMSNVPGPAEPAYLFGGHELVDSVFWVPLKNWSGIGAGLFSYNGRVRASFVGDAAALPGKTDVQDLLKGFEDEILELAKASGLKPEDVYWDN